MSRTIKGSPLKVNAKLFDSSENFDVANTILHAESPKKRKITKGQQKIMKDSRRSESMQKIFGKEVVDKMNANAKIKVDTKKKDKIDRKSVV